MALPPQRISIKRRRDEEPVSTLYIQQAKRRITDFVFQRLRPDSTATLSALNEATTRPSAANPTQRSHHTSPTRRQSPDKRSRALAQNRRTASSNFTLQGVPIVRATSPGAEFEDVRNRAKRELEIQNEKKKLGKETEEKKKVTKPAATIEEYQKWARNQERDPEKCMRQDGIISVDQPRNETRPSKKKQVPPAPAMTASVQDSQEDSNTTPSPVPTAPEIRPTVSDTRSEVTFIKPGIRQFHLSRLKSSLLRSKTSSSSLASNSSIRKRSRYDRGRREKDHLTPAAAMWYAKEHKWPQTEATRVLDKEMSMNNVASHQPSDSLPITSPTSPSKRTQKRPNVNRAESRAAAERIRAIAKARSRQPVTEYQTDLGLSEASSGSSISNQIGKDGLDSVTHDIHRLQLTTEHDEFLSDLLDDSKSLLYLSRVSPSTFSKRGPGNTFGQQDTEASQQFIPATTSPEIEMANTENSDEDSETDMVTDTYIRVPVSTLPPNAQIQAMWSHGTDIPFEETYGVLLISEETEEEMLRWQTEEIDSDDSIDAWGGEDEDSNAEDYYANDYPDEPDYVSDEDAETSDLDDGDGEDEDY